MSTYAPKKVKKNCPEVFGVVTIPAKCVLNQVLAVEKVLHENAFRYFQKNLKSNNSKLSRG